MLRRLMSTGAGAGPIATQIREKLQTAFLPHHLQVINESSGHNVPPGSESHFKVVIVSRSFAGKSTIDRHRMVNGMLNEELEGPVHALSIVARTPEQWKERGEVPASPQCAGGSKA